MTKIGRMLFEDGMKEGRSEDLTEAEIREIEESILLSR